MQGPARAQRAQSRVVSDPTAGLEELLFSCRVFRFTCVTLSEAALLGVEGLLAARALELGLAEGLSRMLLVLQLGVDGLYVLAGVGPGHCALGLSKGITDTYRQPGLRVAGQS